MANPQSYGPTMGNMLTMPGYGGQMGSVVPMIDPRMFGGMIPVAPR
jgi:hypothetical protein